MSQHLEYLYRKLRTHEDRVVSTRAQIKIFERLYQTRGMLERQKLDALHQQDEPTAQQCIIEAHQLENNE